MTTDYGIVNDETQPITVPITAVHDVHIYPEEVAGKPQYTTVEIYAVMQHDLLGRVTVTDCALATIVVPWAPTDTDEWVETDDNRSLHLRAPITQAIVSLVDLIEKVQR